MLLQLAMWQAAAHASYCMAPGAIMLAAAAGLLMPSHRGSAALPAAAPAPGHAAAPAQLTC